MSAVAQQVRLNTNTSQAVDVFPTTIETPAQSMRFISRTMAVCVSSIAYLRNMFGQEAFKIKEWESVRLPILTGKSSDGNKIIEYMRGIYDALEKGYLKEVLYFLIILTCNTVNCFLRIVIV